MRVLSRKAFALLHGWLGAISATFVILIAGSGVMLAFVGELFLFQYGDMLKTTSSETNIKTATVTELIASAEKGYGEHFQAVGILMPHSRIEEIETAMVFVMPSGEHASKGLRMLSIDTQTNEFKGDFPLSGAFAHELLEFHHGLLLGEPGIFFVCILSILLILFAFTGLYLWWPKQGGAWRKAKTVSFSKSIKKFCFSLHGWIGVWSALFIIYFCLTGLALAKPAWFGPLLSPPTFTPPISAGFDKVCDATLTPYDAENAGNKAFPNKSLATIFLPNQENGPYMLTYKSSGDGNMRDGDGRIYVHSSCKGLVHIERAENSTNSVKLTGMLLSLHGAYTFGSPLRGILVVFSGLSLLILAGTGLVTFVTRTIGKKKGHLRGIVT